MWASSNEGFLFGGAGGTVAVKIVSHDGDVGHRLDVLRESLLSANIQHPNVVSTYKARCQGSSPRTLLTCWPSWSVAYASNLVDTLRYGCMCCQAACFLPAP